MNEQQSVLKCRMIYLGTCVCGVVSLSVSVARGVVKACCQKLGRGDGCVRGGATK